MELQSVGNNSKNGAVFIPIEPDKARDEEEVWVKRPEPTESDSLISQQVKDSDDNRMEYLNRAGSNNNIWTVQVQCYSSRDPYEEENTEKNMEMDGRPPPKGKDADGVEYPKRTANDGPGISYCQTQMGHCRDPDSQVHTNQWNQRRVDPPPPPKKVRLSIVIVLLLLLILAVILISIAVCAALHEDEDEKFNASSFTIPQHFNGSFEMPNLFIGDGNFTLESNTSQTLTEELQDKLTDHFSSSSALGRYFSQAQVSTFSEVVMDYELTFLLPEEDEEDLRRFVVSREMVYNVFRQLLYDQETDQSEQSYIDPTSLMMVSSP